jgi:hypothetical protein
MIHQHFDLNISSNFEVEISEIFTLEDLD